MGLLGGGLVSQGSSCLATLGFEPESLWDSALEFPKGIATKGDQQVFPDDIYECCLKRRPRPDSPISILYCGAKTTSVMLGPGILQLNWPLLVAMSGSCVRVSPVTCQSWAFFAAAKFATARVTSVAAVSLLMTMIVNARSLARVAAKVDRRSGCSTTARTLVSPKAPRLPS